MHDLLVYLVSMVVMVPIAKRFGLGAIFGYLLAGVIVGPQGLALLTGSKDYTSQLAVFGVIMMLLLIGLELNPSLLWKMRGPIFGLGSLQILGTFFITVGSNIHFGLILEHPGIILASVFGIVAVKALLVYGLSRSFRIRPPESLLFEISLVHGGEFAFVLIAQAGGLVKAELFMVNNRRSILDLSKRFQVDDQETFMRANRQITEQLEAMPKSDPDELLQGASSDWNPPA